MSFLEGLLYFFFTISALLIILIVLFRPSDSSMAGPFGNMGSDNVFGVRATQLIDKIIAVIAVIFLVLALLITIVKAQSRGTTGTPNEGATSMQQVEPHAERVDPRA